MSSRNNSIQILRGISLLAILLFHAFPGVFNSGYLGVDVFFLVSGFVIAPQIRVITNSKNKKVETLNFFKKRFWRLTPALFIALIFTIFLFFLLGGVNYIKDTLLQAFFTSIFLGNFSAAFFLGDYFIPMPNPLLHTWSLSLEEQIYIFTPIAFILATRIFSFFKVFHLYVIFGGLSLIYLLLSPYLSSQLVLDDFYSPVARYWQFCAGALLFFICEREGLIHEVETPNARNAKVLLFTILFSFILIGPKNFLFLLIVFVIFRKVIFFQLDVVLPKIISKILVMIGDRSYSIYLVHLPLLWVFQYSPILQYLGLDYENEFSILLGLIATFFAGNYLYEYVEVRYRSKSFRASLPARVLMRKTIFVASSFFVLIGSGLLAESANFGLTRTVLDRPLNQMDPVAGEDCYLMNGNTPCKFSSGFEGPEAVLIGDSHAGSLALSLKEIILNTSDFTTLLQSGCQYVDDSTIKRKEFLKITDDCKLYSDRVKSYVQQGNIKTILASYRSSSLRPQETSSLSYLNIQLRGLIELGRYCSCRVILIGPTPEFPINPNFFQVNRLVLAGNENPTHRVSRKLMNELPFENDLFWQKSIARLENNIHYLGVIDVFCDLSSCTRWNSGWLFSDPDHLSDLGAQFVFTKLGSEILDLLPN